MQSKVIVITCILISGLMGCSKPSKIDDYVRQEIAAEDAGDLDKALQISFKIIDSNPKDLPTIAIISGLYGKKGDFQQEIAWAQKAIALDDKSDKAYINLGNGYAGLNQFEEAERAYTKAVNVNPSSPMGHYSLGVLNEIKGNFKGAISSYQAAIAVDSTFANGYFNLAAAQANLGRFDEAAKNLKIVLALDPGAEDAREMLDKVLQARAAQKKELSQKSK